MRKLYRSEENKVFTGVIGGVGEYLDIDPVALRVLWVFLTVFTGVVPGCVVYIFATMIIPKRPHMTHGHGACDCSETHVCACKTCACRRNKSSHHHSMSDKKHEHKN